MKVGIRERIMGLLRREVVSRLGPLVPVRRANRAARVVVDRIDSELGVGHDWANPRYGEYYASSAAVHAAVRVRAEAVSRPPLMVLRRGRDGSTEPAGPGDPFQALLDRPNPVWSRAELWRATETYLALWGSAFWGIERDDSGRAAELWPLRPDRVRVLPDRARYVRGFVYEYLGERVAYLPGEVVWFRQFNPLEEFGGFSSVAPARLAVDMGSEALRFNRAFFRNSATPGSLAITTEETPTDDEVSEFYERWSQRFQGAAKAHRPILLSRGMDAKRLDISHRDMEFISSLKWSVEEVARAFGVPRVFLADLLDATLANVRSQEMFLWRNTIVPELRLLEDAVTRSLGPLFGGPGEYEVRFDLSQIEALQDSENDRTDRLVKLIGAGVLTPNEARAERGLPAL